MTLFNHVVLMCDVSTAENVNSRQYTSRLLFQYCFQGELLATLIIA